MSTVVHANAASPAKGRPLAASRLPLFASVVTSAGGTFAAGAAIMALSWAYLSGGGSPVLAAAIVAALHLPVSIGMAFGGRLSDRLGPRRVLLATDAAAAVLAAAGLVMLVLPSGGLIAAVACFALANLFGSPGMIAQDSRIPELSRLAGMKIERANGMREIFIQLGQVGGPASGVLLVEFAGLPATLAVVTLVLVCVTVIDFLAFPAFGSARAQGAARARGALSLIFRDPFLRIIVPVGVLLVGTFSALDEVLAPNLALAPGLGGEALAGFLASMGGSALAGAFLYSAWGMRLGGGKAMIAGTWLIAAGLALLAFAPAATGFRFAPFLIGLGAGPLWPIVISAIHKGVPSALRGGVIGLLAAIVLLAQPAASLIAGPTVARLGPDALATILAGMAAAIAIALPFSTAFRRAGVSRGALARKNAPAPPAG
jgi:predicted MFS family arabinose efflux permease